MSGVGRVGEDPAEVVEPSALSDGFNCPHGRCGVFAHQLHGEVLLRFPPTEPNPAKNSDWIVRRCERCGRINLWVRSEIDPNTYVLIYPSRFAGARPHPDTPDRVMAVYEEARAVASRSPRSAAGLLRLALQMLVDELVEGSAKLDTKIGTLVSRGLDPAVQKAMDVLRVVGNNAVHPGQIQIDEDPELVPALFGLLNLVVEQMIARPKHVDSLFDLLPQSARDGIEQRNAKATGGS